MIVPQSQNNTGNPMGTREVIAFVFVFVYFTGLILAWKWEGLGGLIAIACTIAFAITLQDTPGFLHLFMVIPGLLFLICWFLSRGITMKKLIFRTNNIVLILTILASVLMESCVNMSETIHDKTAGMNGSFEVTKSGLPVNWLIYTPKTIPTGDYDLIIDTTDYKDGKQSLKFLVRECSPVGGWYSPGFCNQYEAKPGEAYMVSFWIKNDGCEFFVQIGGVSATKGEYETIVKSKESIDTWQLFEYNYTISQEMDAIRFEMNILQPGSFWIDDIKIERIDDKIE